VTARLSEEHLAGIAAIASRLEDALADGDWDHAAALAAELDLEVTILRERLRGRS
jgi:hypothetical protein